MKYKLKECQFLIVWRNLWLVKGNSSSNINISSSNHNLMELLNNKMMIGRKMKFEFLLEIN